MISWMFLMVTRQIMLTILDSKLSYVTIHHSINIFRVSSYNLARGFESSTNMMTVRFKTNYDITDKGWLATWKAKKDMPVISQSGSNGTMVSPNYPLTYDSYDEQVYQISVAWGMQVNLTIDVFRTENKYDYLNIYNSTTQSNSTLVTT